MAKQGSTWEKMKKPLVLVLFLGFVFIFVYRFFLEADEPRRKTAPQANSNSRTTTTSRSTAPVQTQRQVESASTKSSNRKEELERELANLTELDLGVLVGSAGSPKTTERGNIFAYYVEPPKPPPPAPPPPPITLEFAQPQSVIATTPKAFTLTVSGRGYPADAQIILNGRARPTKRVNETTLTTEIQPGDYASSGSQSIEVRSQSEPAKFYSTQLALNVQAPPDPPFKYYGETGGNALLEIGGNFAHKGYRRGDTIQGVWRIDAITRDGIDVTHLQLNIKRRVPKQDKPK